MHFLKLKQAFFILIYTPCTSPRLRDQSRTGEERGREERGNGERDRSQFKKLGSRVLTSLLHVIKEAPKALACVYKIHHPHHHFYFSKSELLPPQKPIFSLSLFILFSTSSRSLVAIFLNPSCSVHDSSSHSLLKLRLFQ